MKREFSAGAVIFYKKGQSREYLLLLHHKKQIDFPKGHYEKGEAGLEAAKREIFEETGLKKLRFYRPFKKTIRYFFYASGPKKSAKKEKILKFVNFFLARSYTRKVKVSFEHSGYKWLSYKEALAVVKYKNARELLMTAEQFLKNTGARK